MKLLKLRCSCLKLPDVVEFAIFNKWGEKIFEDETGEIDCVFFNSYEGYIRKILPLNENVTISGKINYFKNRYQITNPTYVSKESNLIKKIHNKYSLTEGISEKQYNKIARNIVKYCI